MTVQNLGVSPAWASPLRNLLQGFADQEPRPILPALALFAGQKVSEEDLVEFIKLGSASDNAIIAVRLAFAKWDSNDSLKILDAGGERLASGTVARRIVVCKALGLSDSAERAIREVLPVHSDRTIVISRDFEPWYEKARTERSSLYWDDYRQYLAEVKKWPAASITDLDNSTTSVIERLSDPTREAIKQTKGLVVGYVQSGKTANFTGVVAKAVDAGYRLIVVMTGTIEILRAQTQRRIDMELMGVENVLAGQDPNDPDVVRGLDYQNDEDWLADKFVRHSEASLDQPGVVRIRRVTTHGHDYKSLPQAMSQLRYERKDKTRPLNAPENLLHADAYVVVVKKNSAPLKKLLKDLRPLQKSLHDLPALIIDDESDLASVDTTDPKKWRKSPEARKRTAINALITDMLKLVPRAQYVGYTATPFANVFVDPDDDSDLFPSDFVLSLDRPHGYMGVSDFHDLDPDWENNEKNFKNSNELAYVRAIVGDSKDDPDLRSRELSHAVDAWVLSGAIKKYREKVNGREYRHHTMLVHESVAQDVQLEGSEEVRKIWNTGRFTSAQGLTRLQALYDSDYLPVMRARAEGEAVPSKFADLKVFVAEAVAEMTSSGSDPVLVVNSDKSVQDQQQALDFDSGKVWRILVGGTKLSRGFTVEGLTISYFRRKAGQADTLMQAGRWFGFRNGYRDLVRLYIRRDEAVDLYEAFEALLLDEESFRDELSKYVGVDEEGKPLVEPRQIPPLVSQHLPWLKPTARNKMFNAVIASRASAGTFHQLSSIPPRSDRVKNLRNLVDVIIPLLRNATQDAVLPYEENSVPRSQPAKVGLISASEFLVLFDKMDWHSDFLGVIQPLRAFIVRATDKGGIKDWAVVWPQRQSEGRMLGIPGLPFQAPIFHRSRRAEPRIDFTGENKRNILAADPFAEGLNVDPLGSSPARGVLVLTLVADQMEKDESAAVDVADVVGLLSLRVPDRSIRSRRELIQYTVVAAEHPDQIVVEGE